MIFLDCRSFCYFFLRFDFNFVSFRSPSILFNMLRNSGSPLARTFLKFLEQSPKIQNYRTFSAATDSSNQSSQDPEQKEEASSSENQEGQETFSEEDKRDMSDIFWGFIRQSVKLAVLGTFVSQMYKKR